MKLRLSPAAVARVAGPVVGALCRTWRFAVSGEAHWTEARGGDRPLVIALWHDALLPLLWQRRGLGITIVVSAARDGQYLADFAGRLGYEAARGSSHRGGVRALVGAIRVLRDHGTVAFTPDGPRGPRREFKPGFLAAAQKTGALVLPMHASSRWARRLHSWDRMLIPGPGARVHVVIGAPFAVPEGSGGMAEGQQLAEAAMAAVVREAEWRSGAATDIG